MRNRLRNIVRPARRRAHRDRRGATSVEYAMILAFVVLVMLVALSQVADVTIGLWGNVSDKVQKAS
ncbi:Flp family type IVb pilin [Sphingomonas sp. Leaf343]|uniref:Flp family type IVb pilin n=1 Tax=Sphingomonas sp. Leaf343 TaxID=1736345 RepID=UPI0006F73E4A|nr:Flp family type IVb pilin [Sphingomonas sp. Leaf343]KQR84016.1 hypothetical protein ASG07_05250 [Sphingomonas sp. Leaf343]